MKACPNCFILQLANQAAVTLLLSMQCGNLYNHQRRSCRHMDSANQEAAITDLRTATRYMWLP